MHTSAIVKRVSSRSSKQASKRQKRTKLDGKGKETVVQALLSKDLHEVYKKKTRAPIGLIIEKAIALGLEPALKQSAYHYLRTVFRTTPCEEDLVSVYYEKEWETQEFLDWLKLNKHPATTCYTWKNVERRAGSLAQLQDIKDELISEVTTNEK